MDHRICRFCLRSHQEVALLKIFGQEGLKDLARKLQYVLPFKISVFDKLPKYICYQCCTQIDQWHTFVVNAVKTNKTLVKHLYRENGEKLMILDKLREDDNLPSSSLANHSLHSLVIQQCQQATWVSSQQASTSDDTDSVESESSQYNIQVASLHEVREKVHSSMAKSHESIAIEPDVKAEITTREEKKPAIPMDMSCPVQKTESVIQHPIPSHPSAFHTIPMQYHPYYQLPMWQQYPMYQNVMPTFAFQPNLIQPNIGTNGNQPNVGPYGIQPFIGPNAFQPNGTKPNIGPNVVQPTTGTQPSIDPNESLLNGGQPNDVKHNIGPVVVQSNNGPNLVLPNIGPHVAQPNIGPHVAQPNIGPHVAQPNIGPHVFQPNIGPIVVQSNNGPNLVQPNIGPTINGPNNIESNPSSNVAPSNNGFQPNNDSNSSQLSVPIKTDEDSYKPIPFPPGYEPNRPFGYISVPSDCYQNQPKPIAQLNQVLAMNEVPNPSGALQISAKPPHQSEGKPDSGPPKENVGKQKYADILKTPPYKPVANKNYTPTFEDAFNLNLNFCRDCNTTLKSHENLFDHMTTCVAKKKGSNT